MVGLVTNVVTLQVKNWYLVWKRSKKIQFQYDNEASCKADTL